MKKIKITMTKKNENWLREVRKLRMKKKLDELLEKEKLNELTKEEKELLKNIKDMFP